MAFPGRECVVHLCLHPSDDKTSLASFFFECASDGRKQAGSVGAQQCCLLSLRGWEGQPPSAVLGKHAYQHRGHQVPGKAIYLSPPSGAEAVFMETEPGVLERAGSSHFERCSVQKGQHDVMGNCAFL